MLQIVIAVYCSTASISINMVSLTNYSNPGDELVEGPLTKREAAMYFVCLNARSLIGWQRWQIRFVRVSKLVSGI
jgi:hypothetical protein